ncbi:hypothetical protein KKD03_04185 [Patescibacteria group bacterium]|nr:hypothetical protein [Patescibacteria group bacterium]
MKIVPYYPNSEDNIHCLQACIKSALAFYFPNEKFEDNVVDQKTLQIGGWSWFPPAVCWLNSLGIKVKIYSIFDYNRFASEGENYLREFKKWFYEVEEKAGAYKNLKELQDFTKKMISNNLWANEIIDSEKLIELLKDEKTLAIGKTIYESLDGTPSSQVKNPTSHFVLLIKEYNYHQWLLHDPGLPERPNRKVEKSLHLGDVVVLSN